jgi:hypothetical protein
MKSAAQRAFERAVSATGRLIPPGGRMASRSVSVSEMLKSVSYAGDILSPLSRGGGQSGSWPGNPSRETNSFFLSSIVNQRAKRGRFANLCNVRDREKNRSFDYFLWREHCICKPLPSKRTIHYQKKEGAGLIRHPEASLGKGSELATKEDQNDGRRSTSILLTCL